MYAGAEPSHLGFMFSGGDRLRMWGFLLRRK